MADNNELINQGDIEKLLQQSSPGQKPEGVSPPAEEKKAEETKQAADAPVDPSKIDALLSEEGGEKSEEGKPAETGSSPTAESAQDAQTPEAPEEIEDADKFLRQNDIEKLLSEAGKTPAAPKESPAKEKERTSAAVFPGEGDMSKGDVEYLLNQAEKALESITSDSDDLPGNVVTFQFQEFGGAPASSESATLDLISDVELDLKIELGRTNMYLEDVLKLRKGSVVPLDKLAGDPVDIYINGRLIARGEVLVLNDNFCVRVAELIAGSNPAH